MTKFRTVLLAAASTLLLTAPARAALLTNGDFETGDISPWSPLGAVEVLTEHDYTLCCGFATTHPDNHIAAFGGGGSGPTESISQNFDAVLGEHFTLGFDLAAVGSSNVNTVLVTADGASRSFALSGVPDFDAAFHHYTLGFTGTGGAQAVKFQVGSFFNDDIDIAVDNVTLSAGVPEPASWALMIGGFGLAGAALRRRRATAVAA